MAVLKSNSNRLPKLGEYDYSAYQTDEYFFDEDAVIRVVEFYEDELIVTIGNLEGEPFNLLDWQIYELLAPLYGIKRKEDGYRRFRVSYCGLPRKNGKSGLASGFGNYHLFADNEPTPRVFGMAKDKEQARIVFNESAGQVEASDFLSKYSVVYRGDKSPRIECVLNGGIYRVLSKESKNKDGLNASASVCDETQTLEEKDEKIVKLVHSSTSARNQPLELFIGTSGWDRKSFAFRRLYKKAIDIKAGIRKDDSFFGLVYEAPKEKRLLYSCGCQVRAADDSFAESCEVEACAVEQPDQEPIERDMVDWKNPKVWRAANPSLGPIKTLGYMRSEVQNVIDDPMLLNEFLRLELNVWTETNVGGLDSILWARQARAYTLDFLSRRVCYGGLDLSSTEDFTAFALCFPPIKTDPLWYLWVHLWCPQDKLLQRAEKDDAPYGIWAHQHYIQPTPGDLVDYDTVKETIDMYSNLFRLKEIAFDRYNSTMMVTQLEKKKERLMVDHRQTALTMSPPTKDFIALQKMKVLVHPNNPCLNWMVGNTAIIRDGKENIWTDKKESNDRIDGVQACIMAVSSAIRNGVSIYSNENLVRII